MKLKKYHKMIIGILIGWGLSFLFVEHYQAIKHLIISTIRNN